MRRGVSPRLRSRRMSTASLLHVLLHQTPAISTSRPTRTPIRRARICHFDTSNARSAHMAARYHLSDPWPMSMRSAALPNICGYRGRSRRNGPCAGSSSSARHGRPGCPRSALWPVDIQPRQPRQAVTACPAESVASSCCSPYVGAASWFIRRKRPDGGPGGRAVTRGHVHPAARRKPASSLPWEPVPSTASRVTARSQPARRRRRRRFSTRG
jgi:hypothetical protein